MIPREQSLCIDHRKSIDKDADGEHVCLRLISARLPEHLNKSVLCTKDLVKPCERRLTLAADGAMVNTVFACIGDAK
jgi:hypothetical protein